MEQLCSRARARAGVGLVGLLTACSVVANPDYGLDGSSDATGDASASSAGVLEGSSADPPDTGMGGSEATGPSGSTTIAGTTTIDAATSDGSGSPVGLACGENEDDDDGPCPAECDACTGSTCVFSCMTEQACKEATLACPPGRSCTVVCGAHQACEDTVVVCPPSSPCAVECDGEQSCSKLDVRCGGGTCILECGGGPQACVQARLRCGSNEGSVFCAEQQPDLVVEPDPMSTCSCVADPSCRSGGDD